MGWRPKAISFITSMATRFGRAPGGCAVCNPRLRPLILHYRRVACLDLNAHAQVANETHSGSSRASCDLKYHEESSSVFKVGIEYRCRISSVQCRDAVSSTTSVAASALEKDAFAAAAGVWSRLCSPLLLGAAHRRLELHRRFGRGITRLLEQHSTWCVYGECSSLARSLSLYRTLL